MFRQDYLNINPVAALRRKIHEVSELQSDFNLYGEKNFQFSAVYLSRDCSLEERIALEIEHIGRFNNLCYNKLHKISREKESNPFYGHTHSVETREQIRQSVAESRRMSTPEGFAIVLNGENYPSLSEAARQTGHSRDTIRRWLNDPHNNNCVAADESQPRSTQYSESLLSPDPLVANKGVAKPVSIQGVVYPSIAEAARQRNCSRTIIQRLLRSDPDNCFLIL